MFVQFVLNAILFVSICWLVISRKKPQNGLPPGPSGIPIFGNLFQLKGNVAQKLSHWTKQYGNLYTIQLGNTCVVVLSDLKQIRELFGMMISTSRFQSDALTICTQGRFGVGNARKDDWLEQKNFCIQILRIFGFDKEKELAPIALQQLSTVCDLIEDNQCSSGKIIWPKMPLMQSTSRIYFPMVKYDMDSASLLETFHVADNWMNNLMDATTTGILFLPWLKYLAPEWSGFNAFKDAHLKIRKLVIGLFESRLESGIQSNPPRDLIDALIDKIENCEDPNSSFYQENGWKHAYGSIIGLFLGMAGSTGIFITWALYYLATHPEAQKKAQQEVDDITGRKRLPNLNDKPIMRFLDGVMLEILRMTTISSTGTFHELEEDVHFHGYHLPKGQIITSFLYYIHNDKSVWGDPENFRPERYLNEEGGKLKDFVVAFQPGRRSCPGQQTAGKVAFLYLSILLQKYSFEMDPGVSVKEYLEPIQPHIIWPKDLPIVVKTRE